MYSSLKSGAEQILSFLLFQYFIIVTLFLDTFLFLLIVLFPLLSLGRACTPLMNNPMCLSILNKVNTIFIALMANYLLFCFSSFLLEIIFVPPEIEKTLIYFYTSKIFVTFCLELLLNHAGTGWIPGPRKRNQKTSDAITGM